MLPRRRGVLSTDTSPFSEAANARRSSVPSGKKSRALGMVAGCRSRRLASVGCGFGPRKTSVAWPWLLTCKNGILSGHHQTGAFAASVDRRSC